MKKITLAIMLLIVAIAAATFLINVGADLVAEQQIEQTTPVETADTGVLEARYGTRLDYNLGALKDKISPAEREACLALIETIDEYVALRDKRHQTAFNAQEYDARQDFNRRLDDLTELYFDVPVWEDASSEITEKSNETRILKGLKATMAEQDYNQFVADYEAYLDDPNSDNYIQLFEQLDLYDELNSDLIVLLLDQYGVEESNALYAIDNQLELQPTPIVSESHPAVSDSVSDEVKLQIWQLIKKIVVAQDLEKFDYLLISSDGEYYNLASLVVSPNDDGSGERWLIQVDDADLADDLIGTLVHEYAHYLTLNDQQVEYIDDFSIDRYCEEGLVAREDSLLTDFYLRFWQDYVIEDLYETSYSFYLRNSSAFVSDYAATNASEDIAETFRVFVLEDKPTDNSIAAQKVLFFYERPQYVELRTTIRQALALD